MNLKFVIDEDIANYKKTSMFIGFPHCSFKCDRECGEPICQNSQLALDPTFDVDSKELVRRYMLNPLTHAIVIGGLEPLDDWEELKRFILDVRMYSNDDIVIYTGYYPEEIEDKIEILKTYQNIIVKFGRFIPNRDERFDSVLGVNLASDNQYALHYIGMEIRDGRIENSSKL